MQYVLETTVYPREHERLRELRLITQQHAKYDVARCLASSIYPGLSWGRAPAV